VSWYCYLLYIFCYSTFCVVDDMKRKGDTKSSNNSSSSSGSSNKKTKHSNDSIVNDTVITSIVLLPVYARRDGCCPLHYNLIREVLEWIHDDLRFTLNRHGLGNIIIIIIIINIMIHINDIIIR